MSACLQDPLIIHLYLIKCEMANSGLLGRQTASLH